MVVPVLITSCQVSEKAKSGPVAAQTTITAKARPNASLLPVQRATVPENCPSIRPTVDGFRGDIMTAPLRLLPFDDHGFVRTIAAVPDGMTAAGIEPREAARRARNAVHRSARPFHMQNLDIRAAQQF